MLLLLAATRFSWRWLWHLGAPGLILMGLVDNSIIPTPGGMDILTLILTVRQRQLWWYYGLTAVAGSMLGAYVSYRIGRTMRHYYHPLLWIFTALLIAAGVAGGVVLYVQHKRGKLHLGKPGARPHTHAPIKRTA